MMSDHCFPVQGMLFRRSFEFTPELLETVREYQMTPQQRDGVTIGIHSRHIKNNDDGQDIHLEMQCIDMVLAEQRKNTHSGNKQQQQQQQPCTVYIMSDRPKTDKRLAKQIKKRQCETITVIKDTIEMDEGLVPKPEHGPFAGASFFRDWITVAQSESALIHGTDRSSSALVYELMVYDGMTSGRIKKPPLRCVMNRLELVHKESDYQIDIHSLYPDY